MSVKIGINGFGRMGRLAFRAAYGRPEIEIVQINELKGGSATAAHLLKFDSVHGQWPHEVMGDNGALRVNGDAAIQFSEAAKPAEIDWAKSGARIVIESTGKFRTRSLLDPYLRTRHREDRRRRAGQRRRAESCDGRKRSSLSPGETRHRDRRVLHHELSRPGREGDSRESRHQARDDHDPPRRDQYPDRGGCAA